MRTNCISVKSEARICYHCFLKLLTHSLYGLQSLISKYNLLKKLWTVRLCDLQPISLGLRQEPGAVVEHDLEKGWISC